MEAPQFRKLIREEVRKAQVVESFRNIVLEELHKLLAEGRVEDLKKQYVETGKIKLADFDEMTALDTTPTKKYLGWMLSRWLKSDDKDADIETFGRYINTYDNGVKANKIKQKDINSFKTFLDLKNAVDILDVSGQLQSKSAAAADVTTILDNDDLLIKQPNSHEASRKLGLTDFAFRSCEGGGKDSAWCTTYKTSDHWDSYYYTNHVTFYYVKVKSQELLQKISQIPKLEKTWKNYVVVAFAVVPRKSNGKTTYLLDAYDGKDKRVPKQVLNTLINLLDIKKYLVPAVDVEARQKGRVKAIYNKVQQIIKQAEKGEKLDELYIKDMSQQIILPQELKRLSDCNIQNSNVVFPDTLDAKNLQIYESSVQLPKKSLRIRQDLTLKNVPTVTTLENVVLYGGEDDSLTLDLGELENLTTLPVIKSCEIVGLYKCPKVTTISRIVASKIMIDDCSVKEIGAIKVDRLQLESNCSSIKLISPQARIESIILNGARNLDLQVIPKGVNIQGGDFTKVKNGEEFFANRTFGTKSLENFQYFNDDYVALPDNMAEIPESTSFTSNVSLRVGKALKQLPENLTLHELIIPKNSQLSSLPKGLNVYGRLRIGSSTIKVIPPISGDGHSSPTITLGLQSKLEKIENLAQYKIIKMIIYTTETSGALPPFAVDLLKASKRGAKTYDKWVNANANLRHKMLNVNEMEEAFSASLKVLGLADGDRGYSYITLYNRTPELEAM